MNWRGKSNKVKNILIGPVKSTNLLIFTMYFSLVFQILSWPARLWKSRNNFLEKYASLLLWILSFQSCWHEIVDIFRTVAGNFRLKSESWNWIDCFSFALNQTLRLFECTARFIFYRSSVAFGCNWFWPI